MDLRVDVKPLLKLSISDLKVEIKKTPKKETKAVEKKGTKAKVK